MAAGAEGTGAEATGEMRSLALTPTWSVATVLTLLVASSLIIERSIHRLSNVSTSPRRLFFSFAVLFVSLSVSTSSCNVILLSHNFVLCSLLEKKRDPCYFSTNSAPSTVCTPSSKQK